jgi:hypothetical protein
MDEEKKYGGSAVLTRPCGMLPSPDEALEVLRQAEERRLAGVPGISAEELIEGLERIRAKYVQKI